MNRLTAWSDHRLTWGIAACLAILALIGVFSGFDWKDVFLLAVAAYCVFYGLGERRRGG
jgi:hypothetical protein